MFEAFVLVSTVATRRVDIPGIIRSAAAGPIKNEHDTTAINSSWIEARSAFGAIGILSF
jgi:hypothetical protein